MSSTHDRSIFEKLLYLGIASFVLWPFLQLRNIHALPVMDSDTHIRAAMALENLMEEAMSLPFDTLEQISGVYRNIEESEPLNLKGKIILSRFDSDIYVLRAQVRWGAFPFIKTLTLERLWTKRKP